MAPAMSSTTDVSISSAQLQSQVSEIAGSASGGNGAVAGVLADTAPGGAELETPPNCPCGCHQHGFVVHVIKRKAIACCCSRWRCPKAAKYKRYRLLKRLRRVQWLQFVTLTIDGDWELTAGYLRKQAQCVNLYMKAVRAKTGKWFPYVWKRELGEEEGRLHIHILWRAGYIPQDWLSTTAKACGLGKIVDVRTAMNKGHRNSTMVERYVSKQAVTSYVGKTPEGMDRTFPAGTRIVQTSGVPAYESEGGWVWMETAPYFGEMPVSGSVLHLSSTAKLESQVKAIVSGNTGAGQTAGRVDAGQEAIK
jgi:hypothetical protein